MTEEDRSRGFATVSLTDDGGAGGQSEARADRDVPLVASASYTIVGEFARGGGGRLLRARDNRLDRIVAIKEPLSWSTEIERRFLREAVLTARLEHPAIVPVHEIGRWESGQPFYAMKLVSGRSLRDEVTDKNTIEQRLALVPNVLAVADAIAYAHSQGIIHRDLKPSNVMVGAFGETQVIDWGLAKPIGAPEGAADAEALSEAGVVRGTPATMAPEQASGGRVDERTDVYGIGALLYEVLAGEAPYSGETPAAVVARVIKEPPPPLIDRAPRAPRELVAIAEKAMARAPEQRYPSARELADDLRRFSNGQLVKAHRYSPLVHARRFAQRHRNAIGAGIGSLFLGTGLAFSLARGRPPAPTCEGGEAEFAAVWSPERKAAVEHALLAGGESWARETVRLVEGALDRHGREWAAMHKEACEATSVRHVQSEALLDLRMECLAERKGEVRALAGMLSSPAESLLETAPKAVYGLTPVRGCGDIRALLAPVPPPSDPAARVAADPIKVALIDVRALRLLGRVAEARRAAEDVVSRAKALKYAPLEAEAREALGDSLEAVGELPRANDAYLEALWAAERGLDRLRRASVLSNLVWSVGVDVGQAERAREYAAEARAVLEGLGGDLPIEAEVASHESTVLRNEGRFAESEALAREAVDKRRRAFGEHHPRYAMALNNLAAVVADQGRNAEAVELSREALAINAATLGEHHPDYALSLQSAAAALNCAGRGEEARPMAIHALDVLTEALGPKHVRVASALWSLGLLETDLGDLPAAEGHLHEAVRIATEALGSDHVYVAEYECALADALAKDGKFSEAVALHEHALAIGEKAKNEELVAEVRSDLGLALLGAGQKARALSVLEDSLRYREANDKIAKEVAATRLLVARALQANGKDPERARRLAGEAVDAYAADASLGRELQGAREWLARLGGPPGGELAGGVRAP